MLVHKLFGLVRPILPAAVARIARNGFTAFLTPIYFSLRSGHFASSLRGCAVDRAGDPTPWYTYPAIDFLAAKDFSGRRVLEFGIGNSTLWWAKRAASVLGVEHDPAWFARMRRLLPDAVHLVRASEDLSDFAPPSQAFDIIVVDGLDRFRAAQAALPLLAPGGAVIVDDSEGYWGPEGSYPIMDLFRAAGFRRVDFYGQAPGVIRMHSTSIFFRPDCFLFEGRENPTRLSN